MAILTRGCLLVLIVLSDFGNSQVPKYLQSKYGNNIKDQQQFTHAPYSGVKTKTKQRQPSSPGSKFRGGCFSAPPTPQNAGIRCSQYSGCRADCLPLYQFPNGATQLFITCENGQWIIDGGMFQQVPACQPICLPSCQNRGICVAPNQCQCPDSFSGPYCEFEDKPCMNYPVLPTNSRRTCSTKSCTITCMQGHQFPDGSAIATMSCKDGFWIPDKEKWLTLPDCEPQCNPLCLNGGNCISYGRCQCPQDFRGEQCQYSTDNCNARKLMFNGGYNCTGDQQGLTCSLYCPEGMVFEATPALEYMCLYSEGQFKPNPIPQCLFPDPRPQRNVYNSKYIKGNSSDYHINSFPEVSYIPAGQRWNQNPPNYAYYTYSPQVATSSPEDLIFFQEKLPEPGTCFTWQGLHYKTFDGKVYSFSSSCAHTLLRDSTDNTFSIIVQNNLICNSNPTACHKIIRIFFDQKEYILKRSPEDVPIFSTPKKRLPIPAQLPGLRAEVAAHYIIVSLDTIGTKIRWDGRQFVQVEVQESLWNRTEGLCGNLDGNQANDLLNRNGQKPSNIANWATSWKVDELDAICEDLPSSDHACLVDSKVGNKYIPASQFCRKLLNDLRFSSCHNAIDLAEYLESCQWDYCACPNPDSTTCACESVNVYVKACTHKGVKLQTNWRDENTCPLQCTGGKVYRSCGPIGGQQVCGSSTLQEEEDTENCIEGCYCPPGTVLHEDRCITRDNCPCKLRTKSFAAGSQVAKDCNTCTCSEGKWVCTQLACGSRCAAIGDPHYITFDGKKYDFMGQCSYYLVKTPSFSIEGENVACAGAISEAMNLPSSVSSGLPSCTRAVTIRIFGQTIKLKQNHDVVVNGQDITKIPYEVANITIRAVSSIFLQVQLPNGMLVWWDGATRAYIDIPANFGEKTRGLCGTFNNNQKDDFLTPENDIEQAVIPFANKWKTSEKCNDVPDALKAHPCSSNMQNQPRAESHCKKLKSELFFPCHWIVDPEPYYQDCLYDMCSCEFKVSKCLCPTIASYAEECSQKGVRISWRDTIRECGIHCPAGQKYQICGNSCSRTCYDVATRPDCKAQCVEGCNCPEGEALNDDGECVSIRECKCHHKGLQFEPGYKEVRPATRGPELCTCINALWSCRPATLEEQKNHPQASDLKSLCKASDNMEFTTCEPVEPLTCKNMHNPDYFSASVCHPGCQCKEGFVLDTSSKRCVKPSECPCHHGGRSYKENDTVRDDCNTCKCQNGKWTCTTRPCSGECSAWGDSHFKTFDGKHYDFQGQCDYLLSKGTLESAAFEISTQNVPCGSLGTSCSKSVSIRVKVGENQDFLMLTRDKNLPSFATMNHLTVRQKGLFVIIEAPDLGLVVHWDKGTRVYVKIDPRWKNRVRGLCGNYNDNDADDFQTPSGGITEASPLIFGDSWKLQSYCPETLEITSTCQDRPDRKVWALKKCGFLKSPLFAPCHVEVPVDIFFEKCVFDSCACDQGGDCECLCTALAAYAHECNNRGVPIKWRSQKLCPMQCDERCSNYSPCISTCPTETCENLLTESNLGKTCNEETCIEGCLPKPCASDQIYLNSSYLECVPRNICKPVCLEIDGVSYLEGDVIEEDDCHSCFCSRGEKICKGLSCTTLPFTVATFQQEEDIKCEPGWTQWINQDKLASSTFSSYFGKKTTDYEPLPTSLVLNTLTGPKCNKDKMINIECRTVNGHLSAKETGLNVECSLERGLICNSTSYFLGVCEDFEVRVFCECEPSPTTEIPTCNPVKPLKAHPTNCSTYYQCEPTVTGFSYVERTCGDDRYFNPVSMICDWPYSVEEIRPECKATATSAPVTVVEEIRKEEVIVNQEISGCSPGTKLNDCAIHCDRLCLYYLHVVVSSGFCSNNKQCESGCVSEGQVLTCPTGMFWASNDTCVSLRDCLCRSNDGKPVKPGSIYRESDCKTCQCIDNHYVCDDSACRESIKVQPEEETPELEATKPPETSIVIPPVFSTVTPPEKCEENHFIDLIQGDQALPDVVFNASSVLSPSFKPENAKFNSPVDAKHGGNWAPQYSNNLQYLEIDLGQQEPIYGIKIKGSPMYDEYVTSYKLSYSPDGNNNFIPVLNKHKLPQIFRGSVDPTTPVREIFETPFEARVVKIHPETWHVAIALQVEIIGCGEEITTTPAYEFITLHTASTAKPILCDDPMGLDDGRMSNQQISVSSELDRSHTKHNLALSSNSAWQPVTNSPTEFILFDFLEARVITGIETKGGPNGWVPSYIVSYSLDSKEWNPILDKTSKTDKLFLGNFDKNSTQANYFELPINAQFLKIIPKKWIDNIQIRVEIHGCFEPYPTPSEELTTAVPSSCNLCPDVTSKPLELGACRCKKDRWWDGENCVARSECPCLVGHISYPVGTSYKTEDCSECLCKIGGVPYCTRKQCEPCEKGLRIAVTSTCQCSCLPCPEDTVLCPTSSVCINSTLWCNGIQDCPDDETDCIITEPPTVATTRKPTTVISESVVRKCPEIDCPPGFLKKIRKQTKSKYHSSLFSNYATSKRSSYISSVYGAKTKTANTKRPMPKPIKNISISHKKNLTCVEYVCVSNKPPPQYIHSKKECPPASCPPGFTPMFEREDYLSNICPEYYCNPASLPDAVCRVTGRTFNTFDGIEFKYDICNHILARDLEYNEWEVALRKTCKESCWQNLIIQHHGHFLVLHPNLTADFDGYSYSADQTKKIGSQARSFDLSRLGKTILFVSNRFGFWVIWDTEGNVQLGITRKLIEQVDGLCGFFSENPEDDKQKPDGTLARTTVEFGDSWSYPDSSHCQSQTCPLHVQSKAWEICQVKERVLEPCNRVVNREAFISRCIETTCDCLQIAAKNQTYEDSCRCQALQDFVVECLTKEPSIDISDWRTQLSCSVSCEAPLVYHDCYQRKCEPTCASLSDPDASCPKLPNICFPGCYCPPGTVKKGDSCINPTSCRDCECNVLPHLQYVTYDDSNFTLNANCVYVMSRDALLDKTSHTHKFQVLVTNAPCRNNQKKMCVGKVTILYQGKKIHIFNDIQKKKLRMIVNGERIENYQEVNWAQIRETKSKHFKISLTEIQVEISVYYPSLGVSVKASSQKYGGKLEGLCGDCDSNPHDDFRTPSGEVAPNADEFGLSWLYDKIPGQSREVCQNKKEDCPPLPQEADPCTIILDLKVFGQCMRVLDPSLFFEWCRKDTCDNHPELACASIEAYARDCASAGFCVNWRTNICPFKECPSDKIFNPCGTKCPKTCESIKEKEKPCDDMPIEGCFCPEGKVLRNDTCVVEKDCDICDNAGHRPGDIWKKDKCTVCSCIGTSLKCETQHCAENEQVCETGYQVVKVPSKEEECCDKYACVPEPTSGPTCETPPPISCGEDQIMKLATKPNGCQQFICECKPINECLPISEATEKPLEDGYVRMIDSSGCCPVEKIICKKELCPKPKACTQFHTLKTEVITGRCCPLHTCEPPKEMCIYESQFISATEGGERLRTEIEKQKFLKKGNETWQDGPCRTCNCTKTEIGNYIASCTQTDCTTLEISQDYLDYELEPEFVYDQCCPNVKRVACKYNEKIYKVGDKWPKGNDVCALLECVNNEGIIQKETRVTTCDEDCELGFEYIPASPESGQCCGDCKPTGCVVDGKVRKEGEEWTSENFCTKYFCINSNGTMLTQSIQSNCPELPKDHLENFVVVYKNLHGECCPTHKTVACKVGEKIYQVNETWPCPSGDKCKRYTCIQSKDGEFSKQEIVESCNTNCSLGSEYRKSNESCCAQCVPIACVVGTQLRKPAENWTSPDKCTTYTCEKLGNEFIVTSQSESCPLIENCPEENIYVKGCCKHCNISVSAQKQCTPETLALNKTIGLIKAPSRAHGNCINKKPIESFTECIGVCESSTYFDLRLGSHQNKCSCCQATGYTPIEVQLECEDGYKYMKKVVVPSQCSCAGCAAPKKSTSYVKT